MRVKKNNIAFIIPSLTTDGMERVMAELAKFAFKQKEIELSLISITKQDVFYDLPVDMPFYEPSFEVSDHNRLKSLIKTFSFIRNTLQMVRPDSVLSFGGKYNSFILLSSFYLGIDVFVSDRSRPGISYGIILDILNPIVYPKACGIIAQTSQARDFFKESIGHKNITIIPNPVGRPIIKSPQINKSIINVGRFVESKQQSLLIDIFVRIHEKHPEWKLIMVGDGPLLEKTKLKVLKLGLNQKIIFTGNIKDVNYYYSESSIFAFTSISEGFPNSLLEAMAHGLACLSFDCTAGPSDIITHGKSGYLIKVKDLMDYEEKLTILMKDEILMRSFGNEAFLRAEEFYIDKIGHQFLSFISNKSHRNS